MDNYQLSESARGDVDRLYEYGILNFGLRKADSYYDGLREQFEFLAESPRIGKDSEELAPNLQRFHCQRRIIFYTLTDLGILIVRVLGEEMDFQKHL